MYEYSFPACISRRETRKEKNKMNKKTLMVSANGMDFYCELIFQAEDGIRDHSR